MESEITTRVESQEQKTMKLIPQKVNVKVLIASLSLILAENESQIPVIFSGVILAPVKFSGVM